MRLVRRLCALVLATLVAVVSATPLEALACGSATACPMMKLMKGTARASCHAGESGHAARGAAPAGMSMAMGCCSNEPAAPVAPTISALAPAPAATPISASPASVITALEAALDGAAPRADHAALGLYTLHAVWRI